MDLLKFLKDNGYTQTEVAKLLDTSVQNVNKWCNGGGCRLTNFVKDCCK